MGTNETPGGEAARVGCWVGAVLSASLLSVVANAGPAFVETPWYGHAVAAGELPPVEQRVPDDPVVVSASKHTQLGRHGGSLRMLIGKAKDTRLMTVYGYARLVGYARDYSLQPDLLSAVDVEDGRIFTFTLRRGHKWSDGQPFTSEDFRYYWEDVALNEELSPFGPPKRLLVDGEIPRFEVVDERTVRYTWQQPNPFFLTALAGARPETIYAPAHYLRQFHASYVERDTLDAMARDGGARNWVALHVRKNRPYKQTNPDRPSLQPWVLRTAPPSERFRFERNPYYHRVDVNGRQLPYIDEWLLTVAASGLIPAKTGAGESDLQSRSIKFSDFTFLKRSEKRTGQKVRLWRTTKGAHVALLPNLSATDAQWRTALRDVRVRRALSLGIDRHEINQVLFTGLAVEGNDTVAKHSPLYRDELRTKWTEYDIERANALLDEAGYARDGRGGPRRLPDGREMTLIVETAGEDSEQSDVLELVADSWRKLGIELLTKPLQREVLKNRVFSGETLMTVWSGLENGLPTASMSPQDLAPTAQEHLHWPKWGQHFETGGELGEAPDLPAAQRLLELHGEWLRAGDDAGREAAWAEMLDIRADQAFTLGIVSGVLQPIVVTEALVNVPKKGIYNWEPGAQFGIYRPDTFWFDR